MQLRQGTIRLFRFLDIEVFLHWSWFVVAAFEMSVRSNSYSSVVWNALEYLALFFIVLMHEYGHALACRQVGGTANRIVLWPLGGVAFVDPPPRAGANLWSIAAGPLVNVALLPVFFGLDVAARSAGWPATLPNAYGLLYAIQYINLVLLAFNVLPIYPLDGGQILRSLLWFIFGRARSLMIATAVGLLGVVGFVYIALRDQSIWLGIIAWFAATNCWSGWKHARALMQIAKLPRRAGYACPSCHSAPPIGELWRCRACTNPFDTFATQAKCPICNAEFPQT
ncbi:MAG: M50 family metallopeptidase, partial [Bryobacteraceae bacterium]